jgi:oligopeptide transport system ATP-binding protein
MNTRVVDVPGGAFPATSGPLLEVEDLEVEFRTPRGVVNAVNKVSFSVDRGETLAILGESGSGKSVTAQAIMGLIDSPPGYITGGQLRFHGEDLLQLPEKERRAVRGQRIAMIFQDALTALNPVFPVGWQIGEMLRVHRGASRKEAREHAVDLMERVGIPSARERVGDYPHEFSGGMRQRVMIAMALSLDPEILIADEPTTALDVTVQSQVMELLADLQQETGMGLILITHDLGVATEVADRAAVMYAGRIVETGSVDDVFVDPAHPYTLGLMRSVPSLEGRTGNLEPIQGAPPSLTNIPPGCPFHPRCPFETPECRTDEPPLRPVGNVAPPSPQQAACHHAEEVLRVS